eukprot:86604_1
MTVGVATILLLILLTLTSSQDHRADVGGFLAALQARKTALKARKRMVYRNSICSSYGDCYILIEPPLETDTCKCERYSMWTAAMKCRGARCRPDPATYRFTEQNASGGYIAEIIIIFGSTMIFGMCCLFCIGVNIIIAYGGWMIGKRVGKNANNEYKMVERSITDVEQQE